ncbi:hypothetical protein [Nonomuraea typhae]|uniref:Uncharacterized protein n=1 Tax=Nonomuraea typhae TaxID=2603600 RepID=A0ABW7Z3P3_9ACTN
MARGVSLTWAALIWAALIWAALIWAALARGVSLTWAALLCLVAQMEVAAAPEAALGDSGADVRAYARRPSAGRAYARRAPASVWACRSVFSHHLSPCLRWFW